jgi:hypothetical protein
MDARVLKGSPREVRRPVRLGCSGIQSIVDTPGDAFDAAFQ